MKLWSTIWTHRDKVPFSGKVVQRYVVLYQVYFKRCIKKFTHKLTRVHSIYTTYIANEETDNERAGSYV